MRVAVTPSTFEPAAPTPAPIGGLRLRVSELVRQRDLAQEMALVPGANVPSAKKKIFDLGAEIDKAQAELDAALATDVTSAAVEAALAVMVTRDEHDDWEPGPTGTPLATHGTVTGRASASTTAAL